MAVKRIFVEKRQGFFDVPAQRLCSDLVETFRLTDLRAVRMITRYDVEGLSDEEFEQVRDIVFADPPVDTVYEDALPFFADAKIFAIEPLPGQFDPTAAAAAAGDFSACGTRIVCRGFRSGIFFALSLGGFVAVALSRFACFGFFRF